MAIDDKTHTDYAKFVDPKVIVIPITEKIIKDIMPFFPLRAKVISGYLSEEQLYWKINYHWDLLRYVADTCRGLGDGVASGPDAAKAKLLDKKHVDSLKAIVAKLDANKPNPATGYRTSSKPGEPKDTSSNEVILERHKVVTACKKDFKAVVNASNIYTLSKFPEKTIQLAFAPVASPKKGKHKTGYAIDISGNNADIKLVAASIGASLIFDELSHVHCEWEKGVDTTRKSGGDSLAAARRGVDFGIECRLTNFRHCLLPAA